MKKTKVLTALVTIFFLLAFTACQQKYTQQQQLVETVPIPTSIQPNENDQTMFEKKRYQGLM